MTKFHYHKDCSTQYLQPTCSEEYLYRWPVLSKTQLANCGMEVVSVHADHSHWYNRTTAKRFAANQLHIYTLNKTVAAAVDKICFKFCKN